MDAGMLPETENDVLVFKTGSFSKGVICFLCAVSLGVFGVLVYYMPDAILYTTPVFLGLFLFYGILFLDQKRSRLKFTPWNFAGRMLFPEIRFHSTKSKASGSLKRPERWN